MDPKRIKRVKRNDKIAQWVISIGGISIILSVIAILVLIAKEVVPLFRESFVEEEIQLFSGGSDEATVFIGVDNYLETVFRIDPLGKVHVASLPGGEVFSSKQLLVPSGSERIVKRDTAGGRDVSFLWDGGDVTLVNIRFTSVFAQDGTRTIREEVSEIAAFPPLTTNPVVWASGRRSEEEMFTCVAVDSTGSMNLYQKIIDEDFLGNIEEEEFQCAIEVPTSITPTQYALDSEGLMFYVGTEDGRLAVWSLKEPGEPELVDQVLIEATESDSVTALGIVFGNESLAVGQQSGRYTTWSRVPVLEHGGAKSLRMLHELEPQSSPIVSIVPSQRDKSILSVNEEGRVRLDHMTSERKLFDLAGDGPFVRAQLAQGGDNLVALTKAGSLSVWKFENPHPESSWRVLLGKVWYESYSKPEFVWQSSSASDDFEPKKSLIPLIFGSIKGTFYAMIFAVPLALLAALYTSQLTTPEIRGVVKPAVEIMAAIPSVIIGFLAALWFAPIVERNLTAYFISVGLLPMALLLAIGLWQRIRRWKPIRVVETGWEFVVLIPILALTAYACMHLGPVIEDFAFGGNVQAWLYDTAHIRYDQRNCIIIAFALGFAVIPIIFTIAEDAFSNVPRSLTAASLALGASRWQTVWRVVLPSASPGVFAGMIIGFGRAVGETMIVLMATGNTPIMDMSPFNGMRTLSANIAVEIPEAPFGGTLFRVLFMSAAVLLVMTAFLNTLAEIVRSRLRKKYGQFQ